MSDSPPPDQNPQQTWGSEESWDAQSAPAWSGGGFATAAPAGEPSLQPHPFTADEHSRYELSGELGRGGMGRVIAARDRRLNRDVALKVVRRRAVGTQHAARLAQEAWITARLEHPNIVPIYNAGEDREGQLFYSMRLIRGRTLRAALKECGDLEARLRLLRPFLAVCQAVAYAHSMRVVHRDLKPDNVMLGLFGEVLVVDWGLARIIGDTERREAETAAVFDGHSAQTAPGAVMGTPQYMSPEQAAGRIPDSQADVWSLGVMLFELLTGQPPFIGDSAEDVLSLLVETELPQIGQLCPSAPPELVAVAERALDRDRTMRYAAAAPLAAEIEAWLEGRLVRAYEYSTWDLARRLLHHWRAPLIVAALAAVVLAAGGTEAWRQNTAERRRAQAAEVAANQNLAASLVRQAQIALELRARPEAEVLAASALLMADTPEARGILAAFHHSGLPKQQRAGALPGCLKLWHPPGDDGLICDSGHHIVWLEEDADTVRWQQPASLRHIFSTERGLFVTTLSRDGRDDSELYQLDPRDGTMTPTGLDPQGAMQLSTDGRRALMNPNRLGWQLTSLDSGAVLLLPDIPPQARMALRYPHSLDQALLTHSDRPLMVDLKSGSIRPLDVLAGEDVSAAMRWTDGSWLIGTSSGRLLWIDHDTFAVRKEAAPLPVRILRLERLGGSVAVLAEHDAVEIWNPNSGTWIARLPAHNSVSLRSDGEVLEVSTSHAQQRWTLPRVMTPSSYQTGTGLTAAVPAADGQHIYTVGSSITRHRLSDGDQVHIEMPPGLRLIKSASRMHDGQIVMAGLAEHASSALLTINGLTVQSLPNTLTGIRRVSALADGDVLALSYGKEKNPYHSTPDGMRPSEPGLGFVYELATSSDGAAAVLLEQMHWDIWRIRSGSDEIEHVADNTGLANTAAISRGGDLIALGSAERAELLRDGERISLPYPGGRLYDLAFSPNGRWLAGGSIDGRAWLWDVDSRELVLVMDGHNQLVSSVSFSDDGRTLFTSSWDGTARRWSLDALDLDPAETLRAVEAAWGMTMEQALTHRVR